jgi:NADPH-dependent curcumin reductase CurA
VALCGQIAQYNAVEPAMGPRLLWHLIAKRARAEGFLILDYMDRFSEGLRELTGWVRDGKIRYRETVVDGFVNAPAAFIAMLEGGNIGKALVRMSEE